MRAVVYRGPNDLRLETVPVPHIQNGELLVKVAVCGVCPTDIKKIQHGDLPPPRIFGHETAGVIVKIGPGPSKFRVGDRVALHHHVPCLKCHFCRHRAFAQCPQYKRTGITAGFEPAGGGYAEYVRVMRFVLPGVVKIPPRNTFVEGAMLEPVNTVLKAVHRLALQPGDTALVIGQGPIGLMFTKILRLRGIHVLATDLMDSRLKLARQWGAAASFRADAHNLSQKLQKAAPCLDAAVVAVPSLAAVLQALDLVRGSGQILLFAHTHRAANSALSLTPSDPEGRRSRGAADPTDPTDPVGRRSRGAALPPQPPSLDLATICADEKDLLGSYSSDFTLQDEVARLIFSRKLDIRPLITHQFPLAETPAAVALASAPTANSLKVIVNQQLTTAEWSVGVMG
jgi:L-iditol 2-dehydrogenase